MTGSRYALFLFVPLLFAAGCANPQKPVSASRMAGYTKKRIKTTAYTHTEKGGRRNALGSRLATGNVKSAAADWSRFPVGTKFEILNTGEIYQVDDYGSALVGTYTIDLYKPSRLTMRQWGMRYVDIKILEWGSPEKSITLLQPRARNPHVRAMISNLRSQL